MLNQTRVADVVRDLLDEACAHVDRDENVKALHAFRRALTTAMGEFYRSRQGELLHLALVAFRGIAVNAVRTGRSGEAAIAVETALANVEIGLKHWPDAPPLREELELLLSLRKIMKSEGASIYVSDDGQSWVAED